MAHQRGKEEAEIARIEILYLVMCSRGEGFPSSQSLHVCQYQYTHLTVQPELDLAVPTINPERPLVSADARPRRDALVQLQVRLGIEDALHRRAVRPPQASQVVAGSVRLFHRRRQRAPRIEDEGRRSREEECCDRARALHGWHRWVVHFIIPRYASRSLTSFATSMLSRRCVVLKASSWRLNCCLRRLRRLHVRMSRHFLKDGRRGNSHNDYWILSHARRPSHSKNSNVRRKLPFSAKIPNTELRIEQFADFSAGPPLSLQQGPNCFFWWHMCK